MSLLPSSAWPLNEIYLESELAMLQLLPGACRSGIDPARIFKRWLMFRSICGCSGRLIDQALQGNFRLMTGERLARDHSDGTVRGRGWAAGAKDRSARHER